MQKFESWLIRYWPYYGLASVLGFVVSMFPIARLIAEDGAIWVAIVFVLSITGLVGSLLAQTEEVKARLRALLDLQSNGPRPR